MGHWNRETCRYPSQRNPVYARRGMASSTQPLASRAGLAVMEKGGNAVDAAVAMAGLMPLLEPTGNGLGSDAFFLVWKDGELYGLNASGTAPKQLSAEYVRDLGFTEMPSYGWIPVMVPGAVAGWCELNRRFGTMPLTELWEEAFRYAEEGFPVQPTVSPQWRAAERIYRQEAEKAPEIFTPWLETFGALPEPGSLFRFPDYAKTLREIAASKGESFYRGDLMRKITAFSQQTGGFLAEEDFTGYSPVWTEPIHASYRGIDVWEMPPNGHGITALMALRILEGFEPEAERESLANYHRAIEAVKLAFADTKKYVADPRFMKTRVSSLLSDFYTEERRALVGERARFPEAGDPSCGDTVYFCTADGEGTMVSCIQSNYRGFGSGICIPGTGITLQDRGANFSLDPESDNCLAGGKRSYHTIIPGFLTKDGEAIGPFGVMGGFMQPQGHVQVVTNLVDFAMSPQDALDAPRFQWVRGNRVELEKEVPEEIRKGLAALGHEVVVPKNRMGMGRGQVIWRMENGVYCGGTEPRADGCIAAF